MAIRTRGIPRALRALQSHSSPLIPLRSPHTLGAFAVCIFLLLACAATPSAGGAENTPGATQSIAPLLQGSADAGFDGFYRIGKGMPVRIRLENAGPDLTCDVVIPLARDFARQSVPLPSPSLKTLVMVVVPPEDLHELEISLFSEGRRIAVIPASVRRLADEERLHIMSTTLRSTYPAPGAAGSDMERERRVYLDPAELPENWNAYSIVDRITLDAADTARLSETQRTALSRWVLLGGNVSLAHWNGSGAWQWAAASGSAGTETAHGLGSFRFIRSREPLSFPSGPGPEPDARIEPLSVLDLDQNVLRICALRNPLGRQTLAWYLAGFMILYGLAVLVWLARSSPAGTEASWKWRVVPVLAALFSVLSLGIGAVANTGEMTAQQFSLQHIFPGAPDACTTNRVTVISPQAAPFRLDPDAPSAHLVQEESADPGLPRVYGFDARGVPFAQVNMDLWAKRTFFIASFSSQPQFWLLRRGDSWLIANHTASILRGCTLVEPEETTRLGDVAEQGELDLSREKNLRRGVLSGKDSPDSALTAAAIAQYRPEIAAGAAGPCVICSLEGSARSLSGAGIKMAYQGSAAVVFHLGSTAASGRGKAGQ